MEPTAEEQIEWNRRTAPLTESYAEHRRHVTDAILSAAASLAQAGQKKNLCILGAGNGNDIDAAALAARFQRIDLVDLDVQSLRRTQRRLQATEVSHVDVWQSELSALHPLLDATPPVTGSALATLIQASQALPVDLPQEADGSRRQYDCVVSTCVLSQLMASVFSRLQPASTEQQLELIVEIRRRHIDIMLDLLGPHGMGLLALDFVSSDSLPELRAVDRPLKALVRSALEQQNFFVGCHPLAVLEQLNSLEKTGKLHSPRISAPWRWSIGPRMLAVVMLSFQSSR